VSEGETVDQPDCAEVEVVEKREEMDEVERWERRWCECSDDRSE
jgi:hypothetical protein